VLGRKIYSIMLLPLVRDYGLSIRSVDDTVAAYAKNVIQFRHRTYNDIISYSNSDSDGDGYGDDDGHDDDHNDEYWLVDAHQELIRAHEEYYRTINCYLNEYFIKDLSNIIMSYRIQ
jgi:hypothetical protein